jgi:hypothetical protein
LDWGVIGGERGTGYVSYGDPPSVMGGEILRIYAIKTPKATGWNQG